VALAYNRSASDGAAKRTGKICNVGTGLHHWYPNGAVLWGMHAKQTQVGQMRPSLCS